MPDRNRAIETPADPTPRADRLEAGREAAPAAAYQPLRNLHNPRSSWWVGLDREAFRRIWPEQARRMRIQIPAPGIGWLRPAGGPRLLDGTERPEIDEADEVIADPDLAITLADLAQVEDSDAANPYEELRQSHPKRVRREP